MKKLVLVLMVALFAITANAQTTKIALAIAYEKKDGCNASDLGYEFRYSSATSITSLESDAYNSVRTKYTSYDGTDKKNNLYEGEYMIIIQATTNVNGCYRKTFGVGFGNDRASALSKAIDHLNGRNWDWKKSDGYSVAKELDL